MNAKFPPVLSALFLTGALGIVSCTKEDPQTVNTPVTENHKISAQEAADKRTAFIAALEETMKKDPLPGGGAGPYLVESAEYLLKQYPHYVPRSKRVEGEDVYEEDSLYKQAWNLAALFGDVSFELSFHPTKAQEIVEKKTCDSKAAQKIPELTPELIAIAGKALQNGGIKNPSVETQEVYACDVLDNFYRAADLDELLQTEPGRTEQISRPGIQPG